MDSNHQRELAKFMAEVSVYVYRWLTKALPEEKP